MRRRTGFTLVELLVAIALIVLILAVLAEAFAVGVQSFGQLKAIGDMSDRLRAAAHLLRQDLEADHFNASIRVSDPRLGNLRRPTQGFFMIKQWGRSVPEDPGGTSYRAPENPGQSHVLYFTVKRRGNRDQDFFTARVPQPHPLLTRRTPPSVPPAPHTGEPTTFGGQPEDARRQNSGEYPQVYSSQWAEVAYFLQLMPDNLTAKGTPLYSLHRVVRLIVPDNRLVNNIVSAASQAKDYQGFAYRQNSSGNLDFYTPADGLTATNRSLWQFIVNQDPSHPNAPQFAQVETMVLTDVVSFTVQVIRMNSVDPWANPPTPAFGWPVGYADFGDLGSTFPATFDSATDANGLVAIRIILRVWDLKTEQTRQVSVIVDL